MAKVVVDRRVSLVQLMRFLNDRPVQVTEMAKSDANWPRLQNRPSPSKKSVQQRRVIFAFWIKISRNNVFSGTKIFFRHKGL